jgi:hypothetical protein
MRRLSLSTLFCSAFLFGAMAFAEDERFYDLGTIARIQYNVREIDNLHQTVSRMTKIDRGLSDNVNFLPALFRYELARLLMIEGRRDEAIVEVVKARLVRDLDIATCVTKDRNTRVPVLGLHTDSIEYKILKSPPVDEQKWHAAIKGALEWEPKRHITTSSLWICGEGNVLGESQARVERSERYASLKRNFDKIVSESARAKGANQSFQGTLRDEAAQRP